MTMNIEKFVNRVAQVTSHPVQENWSGWLACCPAHDDQQPSLSISRGEAGRILLKCHAGCETEVVVRSLGMTLRDLMPDKNHPAYHKLPSRQASGSKPREKQKAKHQPTRPPIQRRSGKRREERKARKGCQVYQTHAHAWAALTRHWGEPSQYWQYHDRDGECVGMVLRWNHVSGKEVRPIARVSQGWIVGAFAEPRPLFRLPEIIASANQSSRVYVVEGEKAVDAGLQLALNVTTSVGGSGASRLTDWSPLAGRDVVLLPDNDKPGGKYAHAVIGELLRLSPRPTVRLVKLPGLPAAGDLVDFIANRPGQSTESIRAQIEQLCAQALPIQAATHLQPTETPMSTITTPTPELETVATPIITRFDRCQPSKVEWLWPGRVPMGKLTLLVGDPGLGKSFLTLDLAARITRGSRLPQLMDDDDPLADAPGSVVLLSAEDDASDTICPRLSAAGADLSRVVALHAVGFSDPQSGTSHEASFSLASDLNVLEEVITSLDDCRLVVIDPITAYLGSADSHNNAEMRGLLAPLSALATRTGVALLAINHLNKGNQGPAIYRSMGSVAFAATARSALAVLPDPHNPDTRVLVSLKNNLNANAAGMRYRIVAAADGRSPVIQWDSTPVRMSAEELMAAAVRSADTAGAMLEAADWLTEMLRDGPQPAADLKSLAVADGIKERTLMRAKQRLGLATHRRGIGLAGAWVWQWPKDRKLPPPTANV